jgi:hypothetical protein
MTDPFDATPESVEEWERAMLQAEKNRQRKEAEEISAAKERLDLKLRREAEEARRARLARADAFPGSYAVDLTARRRPEAWSAYAEELLAEGLRELAAEDLERSAEYEGKPKSTGKRTGARRDKEIALLRDRVSALEGVVDQMAAALSALQRHVQFHPDSPEERLWIYGCAMCEPPAEARRTENEYQKDAQLREGVWPYNRTNNDPTEGRA